MRGRTYQDGVSTDSRRECYGLQRSLSHVIDWLQQHQRISYRALKRQFALDDEYLEEVKAELIQAKQVARDEAGAVLVWTGSSDTLPSPPLQPAPEAVQPARVALRWQITPSPYWLKLLPF